MSSTNAPAAAGAAAAGYRLTLEQLLQEKLTTLRQLGRSTTEAHRQHELELVEDLGLIAAELRAIDGSPDGTLF